ncbi:hypothetical protein T459_22229 [Capsicum annuum]|uniref:Calpain-type cysteine protease DEK1 n=1 Tax=Capsicum annuum TaxID=4072 RepID=A0A2G2YYW1_CAPAN|nr:hypothetical protein T459_22229 [Capsicum annuum]
MLVMIVVIVEIAGIVVTVMILAIGSGGGGYDVKLVNVSSWSCDGGMVVSIDTVASVADGGGRGGDAGDSGVVVLVLIDELVGSKDRPVVVDGGGVGGRGVHGLIWYLDDKSQIQDAVRMAEIGLTSAWTLDDFKVAIAQYISSPPMSDTNLKVMHKMSGLSAEALVVLPCYVSLEIGQFVIAKLATHRFRCSVPGSTVILRARCSTSSVVFVFEELLERARKKEEKKAKKLKRLADEFYELLHASKEILHHRNGRTANPSSEIGKIMGDEGFLLEIFNKFVNELKEKECMRQEDKILNDNAMALLAMTCNGSFGKLKIVSPEIICQGLAFCMYLYSSGSGKKNFTDLSKSPHGHSKKVHPKKSGRDSSRDLSAPVLIWTIRRLIKEKAELDSRTRRLETEKNELQLVLEKELDRRSSDWSLKLEKYQIEQHRLRERVRELVEQNVSLQREVSSFNEKKVDNRIKMSFSEKHLEDLFKRIEQVSEKNQNLRQKLTQLQAEYRVAQDNRDYVRENYHEKVKELKSKTLLKTVLREKLYSEEMDIKQLQPDLTTTVRGNNILKCEVLKKDGNINQLTNDLEECMKELGIVKAILPKVFQERDFMWEEVKSYSEMNMLLNYEINMLKRKVDTLDEDFLMKQEVALEGTTIHDIVHQNLTCSAAENVGTAAKPNGIMHEPVRADRPNAFNNNSSSVLSCIQTTVDIPSQIAGPSTFEFPDHALVRPGREGVRVGESPTLLGSELKDQNRSASSFEGCGSSVKRSSSADAGHLGNATVPCTGDGSTLNNIEGINSDKSRDSGRPSLALRSSSVVHGLESQGGDSSTSTSSNQQILDLNLALAFQKKLSDPRITSMLKRKGRHTDLELANLLQDEGLDPNFAVVLKENGLDPMILALL